MGWVLNAEAALQARLDIAVATGVPGIVARVVTRSDGTLRAQSGHADLVSRRPLGDHALFGVGSITKSFVAATVLDLVEEGALALDSRAADLLDPALIRNIPNAAEATVDLLLTHRAGVASWEDVLAWQRAARGSEQNPGRRWDATASLAFVRSVEASLPPGRYAYSNSHTSLLGLMIEAATGSSCASEIRKRWIAPLGLESIYLEGFELPGRGVAPRRYHYDTPQFRRTAGFSEAFRSIAPALADVTASTLAPEWVAGGMVCTADDLLRFALALRSATSASGRLRAAQCWHAATAGMEVGRGLFRVDTPSGPVVGHNGNVLGFTAAMWWREHSPGLAVVLANVGTMHAGRTPPCARSIALSPEFLELVD